MSSEREHRTEINRYRRRIKKVNAEIKQVKTDQEKMEASKAEKIQAAVEREEDGILDLTRQNKQLAVLQNRMVDLQTVKEGLEVKLSEGLEDYRVHLREAAEQELQGVLKEIETLDQERKNLERRIFEIGYMISGRSPTGDHLPENVSMEGIDPDDYMIFGKRRDLARSKIERIGNMTHEQLLQAAARE